MKKLVKFLIFLILIVVILFVAAKMVYKADYIDIVSEECQKYDIDKYEILSIIKAESNFNSDAVSSKNAIGLMQMTLETANWCAEKLDIEKLTETDLHKPEINIMLGIYYYNYLLERYGDMNTALAAYNAGMGKVDNWLNNKMYSTNGKTIDTTPYEETNRYITKINNNLKIYKFLYQESDNYDVRTEKRLGNN